MVGVAVRRIGPEAAEHAQRLRLVGAAAVRIVVAEVVVVPGRQLRHRAQQRFEPLDRAPARVQVDQRVGLVAVGVDVVRSEEHTSELQSLMRISYAVFCLKTKTNTISLTLPNLNSRQIRTATMY